MCQAGGSRCQSRVRERGEGSRRHPGPWASGFILQGGGRAWRTALQSPPSDRVPLAAARRTDPRDESGFGGPGEATADSQARRGPGLPSAVSLLLIGERVSEAVASLPQHSTVSQHYPDCRKGLRPSGHLTTATATIFLWFGQRRSWRLCPHLEHARNIQGQSQLSFDSHSAREGPGHESHPLHAIFK